MGRKKKEEPQFLNKRFNFNRDGSVYYTATVVKLYTGDYLAAVIVTDNVSKRSIIVQQWRIGVHPSHESAMKACLETVYERIMDHAKELQQNTE